MKAGLNLNKIMAVGALSLFAPLAFAQTITASNTNASINTTGHIVTVTMDRQAATVNGFVFELVYNTTHLSLGTPNTDPNVPHPRVTTTGTGGGDFNCVENVVGTLRCVTSNSISSATFLVNISFDVLGVAVPTPGSPLVFNDANLTQTSWVNSAFEDTAFTAVNDGSVIIGTGPTPPVITIADGTANSLGVGTAEVTKADGSGSLTSGYSCTAPAGFTLTANASQSGITNGGPDPADIGFSCSPGGAQVVGVMNCTITEGGVARADTVNLTCPALTPTNPTITSAPTPGSTTNIPGGLIGTTRSTTINFTATGANAAGTASITCAASGAVSIAPSGNQTIVGTAQPVDPVVSCTLTDAVQNGSVACTITDGNPAAARAVSYDFVCPAGSTFLPAPEPNVVSATSMWAKIGLIGLLAALGMFMVGFRRNH